MHTIGLEVELLQIKNHNNLWHAAFRQFINAECQWDYCNVGFEVEELPPGS